jgi:hypothetical protein
MKEAEWRHQCRDEAQVLGQLGWSLSRARCPP